jgi:hypothetical protein
MPPAKALNKGVVLLIVLAAYTMIVLDISIVITALPKIHRTLDFQADAAGAITSTLGMTALVFGIVHSADAGWSDLITLVAVIAGVVLLALFLANERRAPQPIMPLGLFRSRERSGVLIGGLLIAVVGMAWLSRLGPNTSYLTGIALPMVLIGIGQGGALGPLTAGGLTGVEPQDAGAAGGVTNVAHQIVALAVRPRSPHRAQARTPVRASV